MLFPSVICMRGKVNRNKVTKSVVEQMYSIIHYASIVKDITFSKFQKTVAVE